MFKPEFGWLTTSKVMIATVNVVCYKSKTLSNGEHPLMLRIIKDRKIKYQSLGISVHPNYWDFTKNKPKPTCPNRDLILKIILDKELEFQKQILELKADNREFTVSSLITSKENRKTHSVSDFYTEIIENLNSSNNLGNAQIYTDSYRSLKSFTNKKLDIPFSHLDIEFLEKYEIWLRNKNLKETTISLLFRTLRSVYNKAIQNKYVKKDFYPFDRFKVSKFSIKTAKRAISKDNIIKILNYKGETYYECLAIDLFTFSYLTAGINFVDISNLTQNNIVDNQVSYIRQKTKKVITIPLQNRAFELIEKYKCFDNPYLFPILNKLHKTEQQKINRRHKVISKINKSLKKIGTKIGLPIPLTTYVSRHSFATVLKRAGVNIAIISETLGHSDLKTTQIYLDSFENSQIAKALENLL